MQTTELHGMSNQYLASSRLQGDELEEDEEETILQAFEAELSEEEEEVEEQPQPLPQQQQHIQYTGDSV